MRIVIAPDSFKESLDAPAVCEAIARGFRQVWPGADLDLVPMADGGEGTVEAMVAATGGRFVTTSVHGPLGNQVAARWGLLGGDHDRGRTAVIEMAAASGLALVPLQHRNPLLTTTLGTGQLIKAALDEGVSRVILGIGGSATTDGGVGAAQAVGVTFVDRQGQVLPPGLAGGDLARIAAIQTDNRDRLLDRCEITVACDVDNPLCGPAGSAAVYGPQKGATKEMVATLDANLDHLASVIQRDLGVDVRDVPGAGAAGGLGAGMLAFFKARLLPGVEMVMEAVRLRGRLAGADLLITGEGRLDEQSMMGKVIGGVAQAGRRAGVPVIALVGGTGKGAGTSLEVLEAYFPIVDRPMPLDEAMRLAPELLTKTAVNVARLWRAAGMS